MFSAGVNAALAQFFGTRDTVASNISQSTRNIPEKEASNIPIKPSNILNNSGNIPVDSSTIPTEVVSNIPTESVVVEVLPGKSLA
jgi:hypothetical protein